MHIVAGHVCRFASTSVVGEDKKFVGHNCQSLKCVCRING
jgi:hypothetical protein